MALESTRAKATLDADASGFNREVEGAQERMDRLGTSTQKTSGVISSAMSFLAGFGIVTAIRQAQSFWSSLIDDMEESAARLARGAGGGQRAEDFRRQAARARGEAADPFRFISPLARLVATDFTIGVSTVFGGGQENTNRLIDQRDLQIQALKDSINATNDLADGLDRAAAREEASGRANVGIGGDLASRARGIGLGSLAEQLEQAITDGVVDTISDLIVKIRQEIAARVQERAVYDDFLK